ncbi:MAG: hypothetical protein JWR32_3363 [Mycobacterium sp.]|nr:hypothetical protein [Mycobacterium sp.]
MNEAGDGSGPQPQSAAITVHQSGPGKTVVQVSGELIGRSPAALGRFATDALMASPSVLALDLTQVRCIDRAGIDALVSAAELAGESDISLCLVATQEGPVATALAAARHSELFEIVASVDECDDPNAHTDPEERA